MEKFFCPFLRTNNFKKIHICGHRTEKNITENFHKSLIINNNEMIMNLHHHYHHYLSIFHMIMKILEKFHL